MRTRDYRRQQQRRAKQRAARHLKRVFYASPQLITDHRVARFAIDRTPCSCHMCGNPRRFTGAVTRQEILAANQPDPLR